MQSGLQVSYAAMTRPLARRARERRDGEIAGRASRMRWRGARLPEGERREKKQDGRQSDHAAAEDR